MYILLLLISLFVISRADGRKYKNPYYFQSNYRTYRPIVRNRVEYIKLPAGKGKRTIHHPDDLTDLDKKYLELFWSKIQQEKVDQMKVFQGEIRFHEIEKQCLEVIKAYEKNRPIHTAQVIPQFKLHIPHKYRLLWDNIKSL